MEEGESSNEDGSRAGESDGTTLDDSGSSSSWMPSGEVFRPYVSPPQSSTAASVKPGMLRIVVGKPLVARLTKDILETFQICNPNFKYSEALNPKRFLTNPSVGVKNDGHDNAASNLILYVNFVLVNMVSKQRYIVKDLLGQGTFGQVAKCWVSENNNYVAVKIIKNDPAYYQQASVEISLLHVLNWKFDPDDKHHIVRILDYFVYQRHLCIAFEMLGPNLFELIKMNNYKGLSLNIVQMFSRQILHALIVMRDAGIIHCDLKPENILISTSVKPPEIKIIDFGSACMEGQTIYSYIQSRYYRSPEVLLGHPYTTAIDMWSFGCIVAELFLGLPLFPASSEFDLLKRMIETLGGQPPDDLLRDAKNTSKFFKHVRSIHMLEDDKTCKGVTSAYRALTEEEYETRESERPKLGKRYFNCAKLEEIITNYPCRKNSPEEIRKENLTRLALVDFLRGLVEFDPGKRWSPLQASHHPFLTGEPFTCPYEPLPETPRIPVIHTVTVDHNPGGGHWLAAGLSPQVANSNRCLPQNSPHFQNMPFSYGSSYGSLGSHGSYNDNAAAGSSYGSYADVNNMHTFYSPVGPCGVNIHAQIGGSFLGASPDARRRPQLSHGNGFGPSPVNLGPMSLGASPTQFTPPSSQMQISTASPGKYGPTSPARSVHIPSWCKAAAVGHYNRRRNWGYSNMCVQSYESESQHGPGHHGDGISWSHPDSYSQGHGESPRSALSASNHSSWRQQRGVGTGQTSGPSSTNHQPSAAFRAHNSNSLRSLEVSFDKPECNSSVPDPADWDPNYSDESLLQEDNSDSLAFEFNGIRLGNTMDTMNVTSGGGRFGHGRKLAQMNFISTNHRTDGSFQGYSLGESSHTSTHDMHVGYGRLSHFSQNTPSRFGQQSVHQFSHMNSTSMRGERNHRNDQPSHSNYSGAGSYSSTNALFTNGMPWGNLHSQIDQWHALGTKGYAFHCNHCTIIPCKKGAWKDLVMWKADQQDVIYCRH